MTKWKLVPVEPTPEMIWKAEEDSPEFNHGDPWYGSEPPSEGQIRAIYTAMLEAAPQPPKLSDERILEIGAMAKAQWNAAADQYNQWRELDSDEITILIARAVEREILGGAQS